MTHETKRRGPKGDRGQLRDAILEAAKEEFNANGYEETTMRRIGKRLDCNPSLVTYYYGSKESLFRAAMNLPEDPARQILEILLPGWEGAGARVLAYILDMYEAQLTAETMSTLLRTLMTDSATAQRFRNYAKTEVLDRIASSIEGSEEVATELELIVATVSGVMMMRYVVRIEPLASMPGPELIARMAPVVQARFDRVSALLSSKTQTAGGATRR